MKKGIATYKFASGNVAIYEHQDNQIHLQKGFALRKQTNGEISYRNESDPKGVWDYFDELWERDPKKFETLVKDGHIHHLMTRL